jgi:hypothetical protein
MLLILLLAIKAAAIRCRDGHFDRVGNVAVVSTETSDVNPLTSCISGILNITCAQLRLVGGMPSHVFQRSSIDRYFLDSC